MVSLEPLSLDHIANFVTSEVLVDKAKCVSWLGSIMLEASGHGISIAASDFLTLWKDQLPEKWRESATLTVLDVSFHTLVRTTH